jgi:DeoR family fructose operon transcriptional repressor
MEDVKTVVFAEERRQKIMELLRQNAKLLVPDLCSYFDISPATIRNDLNELSQKGLLKRTHGGAIGLDKASYEPNSYQKSVEHVAEKSAIGKAAAELVDDNDCIVLDTGTTAMEAAKYLCVKKNLTIILNDIEIARYLEDNSDAKIIVAAGSLRRGFHCCVGNSAVEHIKKFNVDKAFIAANGINAMAGCVSTPDINQADVKKAMIGIASEISLIADSSKLRNSSLVNFAQLSSIDRLITDSGISSQDSECISSHGVEVVVAQPG